MADLHESHAENEDDLDDDLALINGESRPPKDLSYYTRFQEGNSSEEEDEEQEQEGSTGDVKESLGVEEAKVTSSSLEESHTALEGVDLSGGSANSASGSDEEENEGHATTDYLPLEEEEDFGEFQGFDNVESSSISFTGLYVSPNDIKIEENEAKSGQEDNVKPSDTMSITAAAEERRTIPPLTKDKIDLIKDTMAKFTLKPPSSSSVSLADSIVKAKYRMGDEIQG